STLGIDTWEATKTTAAASTRRGAERAEAAETQPGTQCTQTGAQPDALSNAAQGSGRAKLQAQSGRSTQDRKGLVYDTLIKAVGNRQYQVSNGVDANYLIHHHALACSDLNVIAPDQERPVDLCCQHAQNRHQADIGHLGQLHRLLLYGIDAQVRLERLRIDQDRDSEFVAEKFKGFLERRIRFDAFFEIDRLIQERLHFPHLSQDSRIRIRETGVLVLFLAQPAQFAPDLCRRELNRGLIRERHVRTLRLH